VDDSSGGREETVGVTRRVELDATPEAPACARRYVRDQLDRLLTAAPGLPETIEDAQLLVSELASNAARASTEPFTVALFVRPTWLGLTVRDDSPEQPVKLHPRPQDSHGRGLHIVDALAQEWGIEEHPGDGKTVWLRLPLPAGAATKLAREHPQIEEGWVYA
jgi:anti-sigma regulatory factor (Ser/Thr protein kinase)